MGFWFPSKCHSHCEIIVHAISQTTMVFTPDFTISQFVSVCQKSASVLNSRFHHVFIALFIRKYLFLPSLITRTRLPDIDERKPRVLYRCFDDFFEFSEFGIRRVYGMMTSCLFRELDRIDRCDEVSEWSRLRLRSYWSRRRSLSSCQSIVLVIENNIGDIEVSTTRMDEVPHTDTVSITITSHCDDREFWIRHFYPRRKRKSTSMKGLSGISIDILTCLSRTSYS